MNEEIKQVWLKAYEYIWKSGACKDALPKSTLKDLTTDDINKRLNEYYPNPNNSLTYDSFRQVVVFRGLAPPLVYHLFALKYCFEEWLKVQHNRMASEIYQRNKYFAMWNDWSDQNMFKQVVAQIPLKKSAIEHLIALKATDVDIENAKDDPEFQIRWEKLWNQIDQAEDKKGIILEKILLTK